jgi:YebC/PmpR family DNA-binding regulatory protein
MAGHNKWSKIKHKKAKEDQKKGKVFSRLSQQITHVARQGGGDPETNPSLRLLLDTAKSEGFSAENVKRAIEKGTGEGDSAVVLEEATYEGFGPAGINIVVDVLTDNTNRVVSDMRKIFSDFGGSLGEPGSVSWNFDIKGYIEIKPGKMKKAEKFGAEDTFEPIASDDVIMTLMDIEGVQDIEESEGSLEVTTEFKDFAKVRDYIVKNTEYIVKDAQIIKIANNEKSLSGEQLEKAQNAIEILEEYEDVQNVWTDLLEA